MSDQLPLFPKTAPRGRPAESPRRLAPLVPVSAESSLAAASGAFDEHLVREGKTENTRRAFASDLRLLAQRLGDARPVGGIQRSDLLTFLTWMAEHRDEPCSPKTYARRVTTLKVFFAWLFESGATPDDPAAALVHRRTRTGLPFVLSDGEVASLLAAGAQVMDHPESPDPRPLALVRLLLDTGLKKGELARLDVTDIARESLPPSLLVRYESARLAIKQRRVSFSASALIALDRYRARYRPTGRLFDCTPRNLEYVLTDLVAASGLPQRTSFETLRWTSALRAHRAGIQEDTLRERLGLSPITWAETRRKLELLAASVGPAIVVGEYFEQPAE